jgi:hypothetical protein
MDIDEPKLHANMIKFLSKYFTVYDEVCSTDKKRRIDLVIIHKSDAVKNYPIGIEIKHTMKKRGKDLFDWLKQANDYSKKEFIGFGKCLIITCQQISGLYLNEGIRMNQHPVEERGGKENNISTFLGQFKIGEFQKYNENGVSLFRIVYLGQIIWDQHRDSFRTNNYSRLCL